MGVGIAAVPRAAETIEFCFVLMEGYSAISLTLMLETLREANQALGCDRYRSVLVADDQSLSMAVPGVALLTDLQQEQLFDVLVLVGGVAVQGGCSERLALLVRQQQRRGGRLLAIEGAVGLLGRWACFGGVRYPVMSGIRGIWRICIRMSALMPICSVSVRGFTPAPGEWRRWI